MVALWVDLHFYQRVNSVTFDESLAGLFFIMSSLAFVVNFHGAHYYHAWSG